MARPIALVGLPGSGKSTVGELLATRLGCTWCDVDGELEQLSGWSASRWIEEKGLPAFRAAEALFLARLAAERTSAPQEQGSLVVATGGGAVETAEVRQILACWSCFWLDAPDPVLLERCGSGSRPLLPAEGASSALQQLRGTRQLHYRQLAGEPIDTSDCTPSTIVDVILGRLEEDLG
ncbi:MAG: shikimate kinase [Planctomycetota bacterium]|nr:shikimate kinase [Planctomycetota bacterium]